MAEPADSFAAERPSSVAGTSPPRGPVPSDAERASAAAMAARLAPGEPTAPPDPLTIRQWLWGPGLHIPGTAEDVLALARPFAATAATRLLDVAAGLGGAARAIAAQSGAYVSALERDPDLARRGRALSITAGRYKQVPVGHMDPETLELRAGAFDGILGREASHLVRDKERFMRVLILGIPPAARSLALELAAIQRLLAQPRRRAARPRGHQRGLQEPDRRGLDAPAAYRRPQEPAARPPPRRGGRGRALDADRRGAGFRRAADVPVPRAGRPGPHRAWRGQGRWIGAQALAQPRHAARLTRAGAPLMFCAFRSASG